jgi:hypothetical protein
MSKGVKLRLMLLFYLEQRVCGFLEEEYVSLSIGNPLIFTGINVLIIILFSNNLLSELIACFIFFLFLI